MKTKIPFYVRLPFILSVIIFCFYIFSGGNTQALLHPITIGATLLSTLLLFIFEALNKLIETQKLSFLPKKEREKVILPINLNSYWVSGFTAGDGGFSIGIRPKTNQIYFRFHVTQHSRDTLLMELFIKFFGLGKVNVRSNKNRCDYYVQDFFNIYEIIIPHFEKYPLNNSKELDFLDFKKAANLYKEDKKNNTEAIKDIISKMNSKRK